MKIVNNAKIAQERTLMINNHSGNSSSLTAIALTQDDINLITFALRRFAKESAFSTNRVEAEKLIIYIERENKELNEK